MRSRPRLAQQMASQIISAISGSDTNSGTRVPKAMSSAISSRMSDSSLAWYHMPDGARSVKVRQSSPSSMTSA